MHAAKLKYRVCPKYHGVWLNRNLFSAFVKGGKFVILYIVPSTRSGRGQRWPTDLAIPRSRPARSEP